MIVLSAPRTFVDGFMSNKLPQFQRDNGPCFGFIDVERVTTWASAILPNPFRGKPNGRRLRKQVLGAYTLSERCDMTT